MLHCEVTLVVRGSHNAHINLCDNYGIFFGCQEVSFALQEMLKGMMITEGKICQSTALSS